MAWFDGFELATLPVATGATLRVRLGGNPAGKPLVLLHGYPQTHVMWRRVAERLASRFRLVLPDLRGYGDSTGPALAPEAAHAHAAMSKRALAADLAALMTQLGHARFLVAGHDRGGRVAHRLALDHPERVERLALIDIVPTLDVYEGTTRALATLYYHWFFLIQPEPLPERLIGADPAFYLRWTLGGLGSQGLASYEPEALADYERCFARAEVVHAACEDYRASAGIDLEHDRAARATGTRIACDTLVLWGARGVVARLYEPLALWQPQCAAGLSGKALAGGHFLPEELPEETALRLGEFFGAPG